MTKFGDLEDEDFFVWEDPSGETTLYRKQNGGAEPYNLYNGVRHGVHVRFSS